MKVESKGESIQAITLLGDFFLHPEHVLEKIEESLLGVRLSEETISNKIQSVLDNNKATLIGAMPTDFGQAIMAALMQSDHNS